MTAEHTPALDDLPGGFMVTDSERNIVYANRYFESRFGFVLEDLYGRNLRDILSRAATIILESYVLPLLLHEGHCEEIQLVMLDAAGNQEPVIINAVTEEGGWIHWAVYSSTRRDKLYQDLVEARRSLEHQATDLRVLSATDDLTGLLNRRELMRQAESLIAGAQRKHRPVSVLMLDIDNFKEVNDSWGHGVGDTVLKELGVLLQRYGRTSDVIARFGGDEFVCLLPDTDVAEATAFANRLRQLVSQLDSAAPAITVSIGLATETNDIDFERLSRKADKALYEAKRAGRNESGVAPSDNEEH